MVQHSAPALLRAVLPREVGELRAATEIVVPCHTDCYQYVANLGGAFYTLTELIVWFTWI